MVQAIISIDEKTNHVLNIIKAKYCLKDKSEAIEMMVKQYESLILEPALRPEYVEKLRAIKKSSGKRFTSTAELDAKIRNKTRT